MTGHPTSDIGICHMNGVSTREAARKLGVSLFSLQRYIAAQRISAPKLQRIGGVRVRLWTDQDIKRVRKELPGIKNGRSKARKVVNQKKKAALYCRVSTGDQHVETQLLDLREMAKQRGYEIVHGYADIISGANSKRPGLDQLLVHARRHRFDIVLVAASDTVARTVRHFLEVLDELSHLNIEFISLRENIGTGGALGRAIAAIVGAIAELEKRLIVERVRAGTRRAKLEERRIGRAPLSMDRQQVVVDRRSGMSLTEVAKKYHVSRATVCRLTNEARGLKSPVNSQEKAVPLTETRNLQAAA
jgi:DNA invertase Pin-like site-specific DNA recombinase/predicted DNA-binding transcriptional regulator AlpA